MGFAFGVKVIFPFVLLTATLEPVHSLPLFYISMVTQMPGSPLFWHRDIALKFPGIRPWSCTTPNATRTFSFGYQQKQQWHGQSKFSHLKQLSTAQRRMLRQHSIIVRVGAAGSNSSAEIVGYRPIKWRELL